MRLVQSVALPERADQHRPKHPILLAVDQELKKSPESPWGLFCRIDGPT
jgi:hypothetical protein